jgi:hypothetical protein
MARATVEASLLELFEASDLLTFSTLLALEKAYG